MHQGSVQNPHVVPDAASCLDAGVADAPLVLTPSAAVSRCRCDINNGLCCAQGMRCNVGRCSKQ